MGPTRGLTRRSLPFAGLLCLALIIIEDWLFHDAPAGWTIGAFGLLLLAALTIRSGRYLAHRAGPLIALALIGLAFACLIEPSVLAILLGATALAVLSMIDRNGWTAETSRWLHRGSRFLLMIPVQPFRDAAVVRRWRAAHGVRGRQIKLSVVAWIIPLALTSVFLLLFWAANPLIARYMGVFQRYLHRLLDEFLPYVDVMRIVGWLVTGAAVWALLRVRARRPNPVSKPTAITGGADFDRLVTPSLIVRCLVLFNLLFLVQTGMDVYFLWAGGDLPAGMTYAHYARRGAYPLIATALLAAAFVLAAFRAGAPAERLVWARRLVYLWIAQNIFLTITAMQRLGLYVEAYGLTRLRCAAAIWMGLVAIGLSLIVWRILRRRSNAWLLSANVVAAFATLYLCCFINFNGFIARHNVRCCREMTGVGSPIDIDYLRRLGPAALPATRELQRRVDDIGVRLEAERAAAVLRDELADQLSDWRGFTIQRALLARGE